MKHTVRIIIALFILLSGAILVPAMGLPDQGFTWQRYADVYQTFVQYLPLIFK